VSGNHRVARRALWAASLWVAASVAGYAQTVAPVIPPSEQPGRERQRFAEPPPPLAGPAGPRVSLPSATAPPGADQIHLTIRDFRIEGATVYPADVLKALGADLIGHEVTLAAIYDFAQRITAKYGADGYVLSRAVVPPQNLAPRNAVVRIQVIEGYVDKVVWPEGLSRYPNYFSYYAAMIMADRPVNVRTIERYVLLAGDLPGLKFSTTLKASEKNPNAATLLVEAVYKPVEAIARLDNRGTPARGPLEYLSAATFNNVLGEDDALTVTYAGVLPLTHELNYAAADYRQVLNPEGLQALANVSYGFGKPGTMPLDILHFKTRTLYTDGGFSYPAIRSREKNLTYTAKFFASESTSDIFEQRFNDDRLRGGRFKIDADMADTWRGINQLNLTISQGIKGLGSTANGNPLASRADGRVDFTKFEALGARTQPLWGAFSTYLAAYGQYATTSLLSPEQCGFGGRYFGRAYDPSELLGDSCFMGNAELRYDLSPWWQFTQAQLYVFTDGGQVFDRVPSTGFPANIHAASAGGGARFTWLANLFADLTVAKAIDGPREDTRFFFAVTGKY
jgi:hemolysin activation/secretion protein